MTSVNKRSQIYFTLHRPPHDIIFSSLSALNMKNLCGKKKKIEKAAEQRLFLPNFCSQQSEAVQ